MTSHELAGWMRKARKAKWTIEHTGSGHLRWISPDGKVVTTPSTPHGGRTTFKNMRLRLRRAGLAI